MHALNIEVGVGVERTTAARRRGVTLYVALQGAVMLAMLCGIAATLRGFSPSLAPYFRIGASLLAFCQAPLLAAWILLGPQRLATRIAVGGGACLLLFAAPLTAQLPYHGLLSFSLQFAAVLTLLPLAVAFLGLAPARFNRRRIRFVEPRLRAAQARPQFSMRAMFIGTLLAALFVAAARWFPITISTYGEAPMFLPRPQGTTTTLTTDMSIGFSAAMLAFPLAAVAAVYALLSAGRMGRFLPVPAVRVFVPALAAFVGGATASVAESGGLLMNAPLMGVLCALASIVPTTHYLIVAACGYRLVKDRQENVGSSVTP